MNIKHTLFVFLVLVLFSCDIPEKVPENILSEEKMIAIIVDVQLLEATYNSRLLQTDDRGERMTRYANEIFEHHGVSEKLFNESYSYYQDYPEELELIYENVFEKLEALLAEEETKSKNQKKKGKNKKKGD